MAFTNGRIPDDLLVFDRHGNPWLPGTYRKWVRFQQLVHDRTGVWLYVTPKANGAYNTYRDYDGQVSLRAYWASIGRPTMASVPGRSSHGGLWTGQTNGRYGLPTWVQNVPSGAFDVWNYNDVPWDVFESCARQAGLYPDVVVPRERWHVVDLTPWDVPAPAAVPAKKKPKPVPEPKREDEDMSTAVIYTEAKSDKERRGAIINTQSGLFQPFSWIPVGYCNDLARAFGRDKAAQVTDGHYDAIRTALTALKG